MGKPTGFLEYKRELPHTRQPYERVKDFNEIYLPFSQEKTRQQAARCMDCGVPFCHSGCPLGNQIPDFNDAVYRQNWAEAYEILKETNPFPEFTGRICPAPCEGACVLGINNSPVTIEHIEKNIAEKAFELGLIQPEPPQKRTGKKVAVIGSGPAGLAAAYFLNQSGHLVTVFERDSHPGGLLRYGIPDFKLEKWVVNRRVQILKGEGIDFQCNTEVGKDVSIAQLKAEFDAIVLCGGATIPRDLGIEGRELKGIHFAMDYLSGQNKKVSGEWTADKEIINAKDKHVVVIGGGDTGADCVGTANRQGAKSVTQLELLSQPPTGRSEQNPWPEYPLILRTSSSHEEGCERKWAILTQKFVSNSSVENPQNTDREGKLSGLQLVDIEWNNDGQGFSIVEGSERIIPCDLALLAVGFVHPQAEGMLTELSVDLDQRGNVATKNYFSSVEGVFSAGDMRRGQSLVVWALAEGRDCAAQVDSWLA